MIRLEHCKQGGYFLVDVETTTTVLINSDWDFPSLASAFGWKPCHNVTDGTIKCSVCGKLATELIAEAAAYLDEHLDEEAEDPGYFDYLGEG